MVALMLLPPPIALPIGMGMEQLFSAACGSVRNPYQTCRRYWSATAKD